MNAAADSEFERRLRAALGLLAGERPFAAPTVALGRLTQGERETVGEVLPAVGALLARVDGAARELRDVGRQLDPDPDEVERRLTATRAEAPSPGRDQRAAVLEKRLAVVRGLALRRDRLVAALAAGASTITRVRFAVERAASSGVDQALPAVREARARAGASR